MKGKTKIGIELSKTEMLAIGTEVEIVDIRYGCDIFYMCIIPSGIRIPIEAYKIDITDYTPLKKEVIRYRMETIEMKALRIKNILNSLEEKIESGNITIREAAIELHKAGWINYIDIDTTKKLLGLN